MANTFKLKTKANVGVTTAAVYVVPSATTTVVIGVTGLTVDSGLSTFPTIQRSGGSYTLRQTGALPKII